MTPPWLHQIHLTELRLDLRPRAPWRLSPDPDLLLRGVLGRAVFALCCVREHQDCGRCDLAAGCDLPGWYDPGRAGGHAPRPVIPESLTPGGRWISPEQPWRARLWVLGRTPRPSLLVEALLRLAREGLGRDRVPHQLARLAARGEGGPALLVDEDRAVEPWPAPGRLATFVQVPAGVEAVEIAALSPIRLPGLGPERPPTIGGLLWGMIGRVRQVARAQGVSLDAVWEDPRGLDAPWEEARWVGGSRRASRGGRQDLSGWVGRVRLGGEVWPWVDLVAAAEVLGVGAGVGVGRGRVGVWWG